MFRYANKLELKFSAVGTTNRQSGECLFPLNGSPQWTMHFVSHRNEEKYLFTASWISLPQISADQWKACRWIWSSVRHSTRTPMRWCHRCQILFVRGLYRHCPCPDWKCLLLLLGPDGGVIWIVLLLPAFSAAPPGDSVCRPTSEASLPTRQKKKEYHHHASVDIFRIFL